MQLSMSFILPGYATILAPLASRHVATVGDHPRGLATGLGRLLGLWLGRAVNDLNLVNSIWVKDTELLKSRVGHGTLAEASCTTSFARIDAWQWAVIVRGAARAILAMLWAAWASSRVR